MAAGSDGDGRDAAGHCLEYVDGVRVIRFEVKQQVGGFRISGAVSRSDQGGEMSGSRWGHH